MGDEPMTLLLDTHVWLWAVEAPEKLGRRTKALLLDSSNDRFVSAISALEIARLCLDERMILSVSPKTWIEDSARALLYRVDNRAKTKSLKVFGVARIKHLNCVADEGDGEDSVESLFRFKSARFEM